MRLNCPRSTPSKIVFLILENGVRKARWRFLVFLAEPSRMSFDSEKWYIHPAPIPSTPIPSTPPDRARLTREGSTSRFCRGGVTFVAICRRIIGTYGGSELISSRAGGKSATLFTTRFMNDLKFNTVRPSSALPAICTCGFIGQEVGTWGIHRMSIWWKGRRLRVGEVASYFVVR